MSCAMRLLKHQNVRSNSKKGVSPPLLRAGRTPHPNPPPGVPEGGDERLGKRDGPVFLGPVSPGFLVALVILLLAPSAARAVKVADITRLGGQRSNVLIGYGLIYGL